MKPNEARAVNMVQHSGLVGIFEFGQTPEGDAYMVMEFLEGESLRDRIQRAGGGLGPVALRLGRQIASALAAAHQKEIVHRDLKPDNVILVPEPEIQGGVRAKILDFGIAKISAESQVPTAANRTRTGMMMGTPAYMAPEQCRGAGVVDKKADVYSLGVMLFEMISGRRPFIAEGHGDVIGMHLFVEPPALGSLMPGLANEVASLVHRMLAKQPQARPSMAEPSAPAWPSGWRALRASPWMTYSAGSTPLRGLAPTADARQIIRPPTLAR